MNVVCWNVHAYQKIYSDAENYGLKYWAWTALIISLLIFFVLGVHEEIKHFFVTFFLHQPQKIIVFVSEIHVKPATDQYRYMLFFDAQIIFDTNRSFS